jgi:hypothetical protein
MKPKRTRTRRPSNAPHLCPVCGAYWECPEHETPLLEGIIAWWRRHGLDVPGLTDRPAPQPVPPDRADMDRHLGGDQ